MQNRSGLQKLFDSETWIWKKLKDVIGYNINKWMNSIRDNVQNGEERRDGTLESTPYKGEVNGEGGGMGDIGGTTVGCCVMETEGE